MNKPGNRVLIFYSFQLSNSKQFNVTSLPKTNQPITIKDAIMSLPLDLSQGLYHFRFKSEFTEGSQKIAAWIDINNLGAKVPEVNGSIYIKILKTKDQNVSKLFHLDKLKKAEIIKLQNQDNLHNHNFHSAPKDIHSNNANQKSNNTLNHNSENYPSNKASHTVNMTHNAPDLIKSYQKEMPNNSSKTTTPPNNINKSNQTPNLQKIPSTNSPQASLSNTANKPISSPQTKNPAKVQSANPSKIPQSFISFQQPALSDQVQQNLDTFKNQFKTEQQNRQNQRIANIQFQQTIRKWGYTDGKKINNTPTLLATLHQIWPEWEQISLTDMLKPEQVAAHFKKAVIKVHPDKNRHRHFKEKYLSKRIFEILNESRKQ